jgi:iron complex transport system substrate-binding protein
LRARIAAVRERPKLHARPPRVLCLEWLDPLFQGGHWIPEMTMLAGGEPVLATPGEKSVRIAWEDVAAADPEIIVVMPCGYALDATVEQFEAARPSFSPAWEDLTAVREGSVFAVNGTAYFSRPGPRLVDGLEVLDAIVNERGFAALPEKAVVRLPGKPPTIP